jgi:nucleoside-diphosphate-sugar epimerase
MLKHSHAAPVAPKRAVVIGSRGFIGRALVDALTGGSVPTLSVSSADLDLSDPRSAPKLAGRLDGGDAIVVLSALTPDKGRGPETFLKNIQIAASVCAAIEKVPPAHVVYVSSDAVYPMATGLVSEATSAEPPDLYGAMHLAREIMFKSTAKCPVAVLRPTLVFGARDTHNSYGPNRLRRMARKDGRITLFGDGEETRDHIYIDDVAALIVLTLRHRSAGTLNLATGSSVSYAELARHVAALFDRDVTVAGTPRQNPVTHRHFDVTALRQAFPTFVFKPLADGLARAHRHMFEIE